MNQLVSIITPTYNRAYILDQAIKSIQSQTYPHWEMLIIDDGSTDDTTQLVVSFNDPKIKYYYQNNSGAAAARNHGLEIAHGNWIPISTVTIFSILSI